MSPQPWLSIVTVVKDDPAGLQRTRGSLARQDLEGVQWIVLDGSEDRAVIESMARLEGAVVVYEWAAPEGVYAAMNAALSLATGDYVWFVNAGDEVAGTETVPAIHEALRHEPLWLIGQVAFLDEDGRRTVPSPFDFHEEKRHFFARGRFAPHQGTITQTQWLRERRGFDTTYMIAADYRASLLLAQEADPLVLNAVVAEFRTGGLSAQLWSRSVSEFHRARREVLRPTGVNAVRESTQTAQSWVREAAGAVVRRLR